MNTKAFTTILLGPILLGACATIPEERDERVELIGEAQKTIDAMAAKDATLPDVLAQSAGYAVYPRGGEGGFIVGAKAASGVVFEKGEVIGFSGMKGGSIGAQVGAQSFDQLVIFRTPDALSELVKGDFRLSADASATAAASGASASAIAKSDVGVIIDDEEGLLAEAAVGGQALEFRPAR